MFIPLNNKFTIPNLQPCIHRERFNPIFDEIVKKKVTAIVAGAGYGKTTLAVQACQFLNMDSVWYSLDETDCDFIIFIQYLIHGIRKIHKDFGKTIFDLINIKKITKENRQAVLTMLLNEMETTINDDMLFCLDDFHSVNENREIREIIGFLIKHMTQKLHLIIISRSVPDIAAPKYAARREILYIDERDIAFSKKEVESLYSQIFKIPLDKDTVQILHDNTKGWITGLVLLHYNIKENNDIDLNNQKNLLNESKSIVYDYLEENVFSRLPDDIIQFLVRTSIFSSLDVNLCNQFFKIKNSGKILKEFSRKRLFTFPVNKNAESYNYHELFREFLNEKLACMHNKKSIAGFHERAAMIMERNNQPEEAIYHYIKAENYEKTVRLLHKTGLEMLSSGRINLFLSYYNDIPGRITRNDAWIMFQYGTAQLFSGKATEGINAYMRAGKLYRSNNMIKEEGICLNVISNTYIYTLGDFQKAKFILKRMINKYKNEPEIYATVLAHLIFISACSGKYDDADKNYSKALTIIDSVKDNMLHARIHITYGFRFVYSGDMMKARNYGETGIDIIKRTGWDALLISAYNLVSMACYYSGDFSRGFEISKKGIKECEERKFPDLASSWILIPACMCLAEMGNIPEAISYGQRALVTSEDQDGLWSRAWAHHALAYAYLRSGDLLKAEELMRSAAHIIQRVKLPYEEAYINSGLAEILICKKQVNKAYKLLKTIEQQLMNQKWTAAKVFIFLSRCCWNKGQKTIAESYLQSALTLCKENGYDRWVIKEADHIMPILLNLYFDPELHEYISGILLGSGNNLTGRLKQMQKEAGKNTKKIISLILNEIAEIPPPGLKVNCFGNFRLFVGRDEIMPERWKNEKAKLLLKYLVLNHSRGYTPKDFLLELLWPGQDPAVTGNRFHVCLNAIRKILEPELPRGVHSSYLLRKGEAYKINTGQNGFIDIEAFDEELAFIDGRTSISQKLDCCLKAEKIYKGDLFEEDRYTLWCMDAANEYREKYLKVLRYLIAYYKNKDPVECIKYTKKYLVKDEYAEDIYQLQMRLYNRMGNRSMAIRTFELCKRKVETELESPLEKETEEIYRRIIAS